MEETKQTFWPTQYQSRLAYLFLLISPNTHIYLYHAHVMVAWT